MMSAASLHTCILVLLILRVGGCDAGDEDPVHSAEVEESKKAGAEYLRKVMNRLQSDRSEGRPIELAETSNMNEVEEDVPEMSAEATNMHKDPPIYEITAPTPVPSLQAEVIPAKVPEVPPGLTADELKAIYNAAINKLVNLPASQAVIHKPVSQLYHPPPPPPPPSPTASNVIEPAAHGPAGNLLPGYYYYYYPIKSFIQTFEEPKKPPPMKLPPPTTSKPVDMHVTVTDSSNKGVEPLFMAISSFIGMALMFAFSVLFVPKFGKLRSGDAKDTTHHGDFIALGRIVFDSLEGKDCAERLACELGHFLRSVKMEDKPLRVLEIILPPHLSKQITLVRKAAGKRQRCADIPCRLKKKTKKGGEEDEEKKKKKVVVMRKPWRKTQTRHDLWMQHFQNRTAFKQPDNIWERNRVRRRTLPH